MSAVVAKDIKVTVIVPVYNVANYVSQCVESILAQSYKNLDIILVDDGSTDGSGAICDGFTALDERVRVFHFENAGVSAARNRGIKESCGEWICFVDGDDRVFPDYIECMLNLALEKGAEVVSTTEFMCDYDKDQVVNDKIEVITGQEAVRRILCYKLPIGCNSKLFRKVFLEENGIKFFEDLAVGEGFNFNCLAFGRADKVAVCRRKIYFYRKDNPNSVTTKFNPVKWENGIYAIERIRENLLEESPDILVAWRYAWWRTNSDAYDLIVLSHSEKSCPELYERTRKIVKSEALFAFKAPVSCQDKVRALVMKVFPRAIPWAMLQRRKLHNVEVETQG